MDEGLRNLKITGTGASLGGKIQNVKITGVGNVQGDTVCRHYKCTGTSTVAGSLQTLRYQLNGEASVEGHLHTSGLSVLGQLAVKGNIQGGTIKVRGLLQVGGACDADRIQLTGGLHIQGMLNADRVDIGLFGPSRIKEIGGGRIKVRKSRWAALKQWYTRQGHVELEAETIEGDDIYLAYTQADVVRGNRIELGPGCRIGKVEYRHSLNKSHDADIQHEAKI